MLEWSVLQLRWMERSRMLPYAIGVGNEPPPGLFEPTLGADCNYGLIAWAGLLPGWRRRQESHGFCCERATSGF